MATKSDKVKKKTPAVEEPAPKKSAGKASSKSKKDEEDEEEEEEDIAPVKKGKAGAKKAKEEEEEEEEVAEDEWEKGEASDDWDPDFDEFDLPKSTPKKSAGKKSAKDTFNVLTFTENFLFGVAFCCFLIE